MALSESQQISMWAEVLRLCNVNEQETVVVLTKPEARPENVKAAYNACIEIGAKAVHMEPHIGKTRLRDNGVAMEAMRQANLVVDLVGLHLQRGGERPHVLAAGTRIRLLSWYRSTRSRHARTANATAPHALVRQSPHRRGIARRRAPVERLPCAGPVGRFRTSYQQLAR